MTNEQIEVLRKFLLYRCASDNESEALIAAITLAERVRDAPIGIFQDAIASCSSIRWGDDVATSHLDGKRVALVRVEV